MDVKFRPLRMLGACLALLAGLFVLALGAETYLEQYTALMRYGNHFTSYGWRILARIAFAILAAGALLWVFARLGGSKPLPRMHRSAAN